MAVDLITAENYLRFPGPPYVTPTRIEMPQLATEKGKEAMEDPVDPQPIQDVIQPAGMIDPPRRQRGKRKHTGHYRKSGARAPNENTF